MEYKTITKLTESKRTRAEITIEKWKTNRSRIKKDVTMRIIMNITGLFRPRYFAHVTFSWIFRFMALNLRTDSRARARAREIERVGESEREKVISIKSDPHSANRQQNEWNKWVRKRDDRFSFQIVFVFNSHGHGYQCCQLFVVAPCHTFGVIFSHKF